jgi:hypothetical protein
MAIDLSSVEGLTDEQITAITVDGLKNKNAELVQREKEAKASAEAASNAKIELEEQSKINQAEKDKDFEGLKAALAERDTRIAEQEQQNKAFADNQILSASKAEFMALVSDDPAAKHYMGSQYDSMVGVRDGMAVPINADGGVTGQSHAELVASIQSNEANARYMRSNAGSGGSAPGSSNTNGGSADISKMNKTEQSVYFNEHPEKAAQYLNQ